MCSVFGVVGEPPGYYLSDMAESLHHRGPDSGGTVQRHDVILGHSRLAILDLSDAGRQPMETQRWVLSANCEIYNYKQLHGPASQAPGNDAATFLRYLDAFGDVSRVVKSIDGQFAFAAYDKLNRQLHLVVDHTAQKPLYYVHTDKKFCFASSPNALVQFLKSKEIDQAALDMYWALGAPINCLFKGITKVNAAEHVIYDIEKDTVTTQTYWAPMYMDDVSDDHLEHEITRAIDSVAVSDVPICLLLSGGIDSSVVASRFRGIDAIHLNGPELPHARKVADKFGIRLHVVDPRDIDPVEAMRDYVRKCGLPAMSALTPYIVAQEIHRLGFKVAITANGADELFFGYDRTSEPVSTEQINNIFRASHDHPYKHFLPMYDESMKYCGHGRWLELKSYIQHDLNPTLDFAAMAHSVEVRAPYLDHRLIQAALSVPMARIGRKEPLKKILRGHGFDDAFLNRKKLGFSLYREPKGYGKLQDEAFDWCIKEGWLKVESDKLTPRDRTLLKASAFSFKIWWEEWMK